MDKANPFAKPLAISTVSHVTLHGKTPNGAPLSHALALESKRLTFESVKDKIWAALDAPTPPWIKKLQARVHRQRTAIADLIDDRDSLRVALNGMVRLANRVTTAAEQWQKRAETAEHVLLVAEPDEVDEVGLEPGPIIAVPRGEHVPIPGPAEPPTVREPSDLDGLLDEPIALIRVWMENGASMDLGANADEAITLDEVLENFLNCEGQSRQDLERARLAPSVLQDRRALAAEYERGAMEEAAKHADCCVDRDALQSQDLKIAAQEIQIANQRDTIERLQTTLADARRAEDYARRGHEECDYGNKCRRCGTVNLRAEERSCLQILAEQKQALTSRVDYLETRQQHGDSDGASVRQAHAAVVLERDTARDKVAQAAIALQVQQDEIKRLEQVILDAAITGPVPGGQPLGARGYNDEVLYPGDVIETSENFIFYMTLGTAKEVLQAVREAGQRSPGKNRVRFRRAARLEPHGTAVLEVERVHP